MQVLFALLGAVAKFAETLDKLMVAYWTDNVSLHVSIELGEGWREGGRGGFLC